MTSPVTLSLLSRRAFTTGVILCSALAGRSVREAMSQPEGGQTTSANSTGKLLEGCTSSLVSGGDFSGYLAEDATLKFMDIHLTVPGRHACVDELTTLRTETFDAHLKLMSTAAGENIAVAEMVFSGVHTGDFRGIEPTGRSVSVTYALTFSFEEDLISEVRVYGLIAGLLDQLSEATSSGH